MIMELVHEKLDKKSSSLNLWKNVNNHNIKVNLELTTEDCKFIENVVTVEKNNSEPTPNLWS
ncbi:hypothetical protein [Gracilibacillus timonensis]|uniref:hypothetical protein n=1 Tax=Gracilibacillus timonensis TaxID=1816696 RepID=UPI0008241F31|nr:hypothetical protein [Gracilibacillus timonensis]